MIQVTTKIVAKRNLKTVTSLVITRWIKVLNRFSDIRFIACVVFKPGFSSSTLLRFLRGREGNNTHGLERLKAILNIYRRKDFVLELSNVSIPNRFDTASQVNNLSESKQQSFVLNCFDSTHSHHQNYAKRKVRRTLRNYNSKHLSGKL